MNIQNINDHLIAIPADMIADANNCGPGAYDSIKYAGVEICTFENGKLDKDGRYIGPFVVFEISDRQLDDLDAARAAIDGLSIARKWVKIIGGGFHPDTRGKDYSPTLSQTQIAEYDADMDSLFSIYSADPYELCVAAIQLAA